MGRTGRKREGKIAILLTEGKEESTYLQSLKKKNNIYKIISNSQKHFQFYKQNPLMIPKHIKIKCHKMFIKVPDEKDETVNESKLSKSKKTTAKKSKIKKENDELIKNDESKSLKSASNKIESILKIIGSQSSQLPNLDFDIDNSSEPWGYNDDHQTTNFDVSSKININSRLSISNKKDDNFYKNKIHYFLTKSSSLNISKQNLRVKPPVKVNSLLKITSLKGLSSLADEFSKVNLNECIQLWETDEDDFRIIKDDFQNTSNINDSLNEAKYSINESHDLLNKFADCYKKFLSDLNEAVHLQTTSIENNYDKSASYIQKNDSFSKSNFYDDQKTTLSINATKTDCNAIINEASNTNDFVVDDTFQMEKSYEAKYEPVRPQLKNPTLINIILDDQNKNNNNNNNNKNDDYESKKENFTTTPSNLAKKTSTPLRSILKNSNQHLNVNTNNHLLENESPLVIKPSQVSKQLDLEPKSNKTKFNESLIGMTQALECINKSLLTCDQIDNLNNMKNDDDHNNNDNKKYESMVITFDMKSSLHDLFDGCVFDDDESNNQKSVLNNSNMNYSNIVVGSHTKSQIAQEKHVSIKFDNSTIFESNRKNIEKTEILIDLDQTDDSIVFKKVNCF